MSQMKPWERVGQMGRRRFLQLMASSVALAGLSGCQAFRAPEKALPYVRPPADVKPGKSDFYATTLPYRGYGRGVVVETVMGRPIKVDGHPDHPATLGGSDAALQAVLLELYDPDRPKGVLQNGAPSTWGALSEALQGLGSQFKENDGEGLHILTETITSPSLTQKLKNLFPQAQWHRYDPLGSICPGYSTDTAIHYDLEAADLVVTLNCDLLGEHPDKLRFAREFSKRRDPSNMSRWVAYQTSPSITGEAADQTVYGQPEDLVAAFLQNSELQRELKKHAGRSIVASGQDIDPNIAYQLNRELGNLGRTVRYSEGADPHPESSEDSLHLLNRALEAGVVKALIILDGDPVYTTGGRLLLDKAETSFHLSWRKTATSRLTTWMVPSVHSLESWGDSRAYDGTLSLIQPVVSPLYESWSAYQLLGVLTGDRRTPYEQVRSYWDERKEPGDWDRWLADGIIDRSPLPAREVGPGKRPTTPSPRPGAVLVEMRPDPYLGSGTAINNPWLLELPRPLTRTAWGNAILISSQLASTHGLEDGEHIEIETGVGTVEGPVMIVKGQADSVVTLQTGWGQKDVGRFGSGIGYDAFLATGENAMPGRVKRVEGHTDLIQLQTHHKMEGRELIRGGTLAQWLEDPRLGAEPAPKPEESLYPQQQASDQRRWGMVIDLSKCIGCNACVAACGAENNLPVVGPEQASRGRAMHWLRVDHYEDEGFQPVPCMHCENAPCEQVCPVEATVHTKEGLNAMVYNRCVGTRYCSNNCPYKVRRFNFLDYQNDDIETWKLGRNPEVTVRSRGVMEKCTYCVQRIEAADIQSRIEERPIRDGEVKTACQAACPTRAIVFGDLADPNSEVARLAALPHNYGLLEELNTRPRTTYLAKLQNTGEPTS